MRLPEKFGSRLLTKSNRYGLSRSIPSTTKRAVRQECGFGCTICGNAVYQYEHIVPFSRVRDHQVSNITLLCGTCHDKVTRRLISKDVVRQCRAHPKRIEHPWPNTKLIPNRGPFHVYFGDFRFLDPKIVLRIFSTELLSVRQPERHGAPPIISANIYDENGKLSFAIEDNEFLGNPENWDIETRGSTITVRRGPRDIAVRMKILPAGILIDRLKMYYKSVFVSCNQNSLSIGPSKKVAFSMNGEVVGPEVGIDVVRFRDPTGLIVPNEPKKKLTLIGTGGDYNITGTIPDDVEATFYGGAKNLNINIDGHMVIGGKPPLRTGFSLASSCAASLSLGMVDIKIGSGCRSTTLSVDGAKIEPR